MPLTLSGNGTISDLASAPTVGGTALPTNSDLPTLSTLGIANFDQLAVDASGRLNQSNIPGAMVYRPSGNPTTGLYTGSATYFNNGNHYNTSTYLFTCPVAGKYFMFGSFLGVTASSPSVFFQFWVNGGNAGRTWYCSAYDVQANGFHILDLQASDTIGVNIKGGVAGGGYSGWGCYLIG